MVKDHFGNDKKRLEIILSAFRAALAKPMTAESISKHNPLRKEGHNDSGWSFREVEKEIASNRFIFATKDEVSCDQWVSILTFLCIDDSLNAKQSAPTLLELPAGESTFGQKTRFAKRNIDNLVQTNISYRN